ncbi:MAG: hypothetical protein E3J64_08485 [Anaerolineales bacterium]|nr:MAG: hypothetical protein E3J64_08485 [Anaerolineales bacterium]
MTKTARRLTEPKVIFTLLLVALSLWIRLRRLGYTDMWWDQSTTLNRSLEWLHGGSLPLSSMWSTFGVYNAPMAQYLYAVPLLFWENIVAVAAFIGIVNLLGIAALALAAARVFNWRVAWWSALLFTVCPWAAFFGRLVWMQTFVPASSAMLLACLLLYFADSPKPIYVILGALCLAVAIQTHLTSVALVPVVATVAIVFRRRIKLRPFLVAGVLFALTFLPFLLFQFQTDFADWHKLRRGLGGVAQVNLDSLRQIAILLRSPGAYPGLGFPLALRLSPTIDLRWLPVDDLIVALLVLGAMNGVILAVRGWKGHDRPAASGAFIVFLWLCLPPLAFVYHTHPLVHYYFLQVFPAPFILIALLGDRVYTIVAHWLHKRTRLQQRSRSAVALVGFLPLALIAASQIRLNVIGQDLRASGGYGGYGRFRMADVQQVIDTANQLMVERPDCQFVVISEVTIYETYLFGLLREFVGSDRVRFSQAGTGFLYPYPCALYFQGTMSVETEELLNTIADPLPEHTVTTAGETWGFYDLSSDDRATAATPLQREEPVEQWPNGISLSHVDYEELFDDEDPAAPLPTSLVITTTWAIGAEFEPDPLPTARPANPEEYMLEGDGKWSRRIHFGHYVLSEDNVLMSQYDTIGLDSREWRPGDIFQFTVRVPVPQDLPPGRYSLGIALYWYPAVVKLPLEGNALGLGTLAWLDWPAGAE